MSQPAVAIVYQQLGPYHIARAIAFAQQFRGTVHLIQLAAQEAQREWQVNLETIDHRVQIHTIADGVLEAIDPHKLAAALVERLSHLALSALVVAGYSHPAMRAATRWGNRVRVSTILLSDSQQIDRPRHPVKEWLKGRWIVQHFQAAFVAGASASGYLSGLGFPRSKIWRGYDVVDNARFTQGSTAARQQASAIRATLQLPESSYFLYVGRFSPEKNLPRLLAAYHLYRNTVQSPWSLVIAGSGPEANALKTQAAQLGLSGVYWTGFQQIDQLPAYYGLASACILPSLSEPWGLVINEAMACGLPILVSDRAGCLPDLVFPGINGYVFNPYDIQAMATGMQSLTERSSEDRLALGAASQRIIANYTVEIWAQALSDCIQSAARL